MESFRDANTLVPLIFVTSTTFAVVLLGVCVRVQKQQAKQAKEKRVQIFNHLLQTSS